MAKSERSPSRLNVWGNSLLNKLKFQTRRRRKRKASKRRRVLERKDRSDD